MTTLTPTLSLCVLLALAPLSALADVYATDVDGVLHITSEPKPNGRLLFKLKDEHRHRASTSSSPRRASTRTPTGKLPTPEDLAPIVREAAAYYQLPDALVWAVMKIESGFYARAVSRVGAMGLMQLMPGTAKEMGVDDPFDASQSVYGGARYLRMLANRFDGDLVLTLSGYHAGGGAVDKVGGIPYTQTAEYVRMVLNAYYAYQRQLPTSATP
ncbi:MAG: lytic transglycosylase domain-containing protein [Myxococcales bacterium]|nr:lytic transglycosylase domain-containing protein [Myxococcales bacterium]